MHEGEWVEHPNSAYALRPLAKVAEAGEEALMEAAELFDAGLKLCGGSPSSNPVFDGESVACIATADEKMMHTMTGTGGAGSTYFCTCNRVGCTQKMLHEGHVSKLFVDIPLEKMGEGGEWVTVAAMGVGVEGGHVRGEPCRREREAKR